MHTRLAYINLLLYAFIVELKLLKSFNSNVSMYINLVNIELFKFKINKNFENRLSH